MTSIREMFERAVAQPPPSRLNAAEVYASGRARWRRRRGAAAGSAVSAGVALLLTGARILASGSPVPPGPQVPSGFVTWAGAGDDSHLYVVVNLCVDPAPISPSPQASRTASFAAGYAPIRKPTTSATPTDSTFSTGLPDAASSPAPSPQPSCEELFASIDSGRSWQSRGMLPGPVVGTGIQALGAQTLIMQALVERNGAWVSVDGGAHWSLALPGDQPLDGVSADGTLLFTNVNGELLAIDPTRGRIGPLAHGPDLLSPSVDGNPVRADLWVTGLDPATRRPAVARSANGGRTWTVSVLPDTTDATVADGVELKSTSWPAVVSRDGRTAYATYWQRNHVDGDRTTDGTLRVFRTTDAGTSWRSVDPYEQLASTFLFVSWVTADGRHVVLHRTETGQDYVVSNERESYVPATLPGLPAKTVADGRMAHTGDAVYASSDGWTWHQVWPTARPAGR